MVQRYGKSFDRLHSAPRPLLRIADLPEPKQVARGNRAGRRLGIVVILLHSHDNVRIVAGAREIAAVLAIPEKSILRRLQLLRQSEPLGIESRFVEIKQTLNVESVILRKAG